jgi:hypothetical protein
MASAANVILGCSTYSRRTPFNDPCLTSEHDAEGGGFTSDSRFNN